MPREAGSVAGCDSVGLGAGAKLLARKDCHVAEIKRRECFCGVVYGVLCWWRRGGRWKQFDDWKSASDAAFRSLESSPCQKRTMWSNSLERISLVEMPLASSEVLRCPKGVDVSQSTRHLANVGFRSRGSVILVGL